MKFKLPLWIQEQSHYKGTLSLLSRSLLCSLDRPTRTSLSQHNGKHDSQRGSLDVQVEKSTWSNVSWA